MGDFVSQRSSNLGTGDWVLAQKQLFIKFDD
jgi:hypothetical protein